MSKSQENVGYVVITEKTLHHLNEKYRRPYDDTDKNYVCDAVANVLDPYRSIVGTCVWDEFGDFGDLICDGWIKVEHPHIARAHGSRIMVVRKLEDVYAGDESLEQFPNLRFEYEITEKVFPIIRGVMEWMRRDFAARVNEAHHVLLTAIEE